MKERIEEFISKLGRVELFEKATFNAQPVKPGQVTQYYNYDLGKDNYETAVKLTSGKEDVLTLEHPDTKHIYEFKMILHPAGSTFTRKDKSEGKRDTNHCRVQLKISPPRVAETISKKLDNVPGIV